MTSEEFNALTEYIDSVAYFWGTKNGKCARNAAIGLNKKEEILRKLLVREAQK